MLHNNTTDLTKVRSNLQEALYSQTLMMNQNSGRAGQFAGAFVAIYDAIERVDRMLAQCTPADAGEVVVEETTKTSSKAKSTK